jgi:L,D-peptidoglycan transpeptidase YkuD (ErfK/YbiS/YcfS/YnhG family)
MRMNLTVDALGHGSWGTQAMRAALGRGGVTTAKREGDHMTPAGSFPMRELLYRPDRLAPPLTRLPARALTPGDGWCDAADDPRYNRLIQLPYTASYETLWRTDAIYDLIVPLGFNDDPVVPGLGSAIFLHVARADWSGTEGCVALARADLLMVLAEADPTPRVVVRAA